MYKKYVYLLQLPPLEGGFYGSFDQITGVNDSYTPYVVCEVHFLKLFLIRAPFSYKLSISEFWEFAMVGNYLG